MLQIRSGSAARPWYEPMVGSPVPRTALPDALSAEYHCATSITQALAGPAGVREHWCVR